MNELAALADGPKRPAARVLPHLDSGSLLVAAPYSRVGGGLAVEALAKGPSPLSA